ncbi:MAG TPA: DUF1428 domain-containing protein [Planctomycetota bacterium]|nr:DUF1428 domain-containing protein [Planctomycetota bacterium]
MSAYVDGFLLPIRKKNLKAYRAMAAVGGKIWKKHGALEYRECVGDDLEAKCGISYGRLLKLKPGETVFYSFIVYRSRAHRDAVNKKVMKDPAIQKMVAGKKMPFDVKRMSYGGFKTVVDM